ncbi:hypothetical protein [Maribellus sediminis]|uniref:hypothetical protein n=1 Tax=Maribellus sediminis TaxID=2696285 RepID=UPI00142F6AFB|nr:hypothetical protein [Maribellus sediminis]
MQFHFKIILIVTITILIARELHAQETKNNLLKCNIEIVLEMSENIENCNDELIVKFLQSFGRECKSNVEYCEFSNEVLFKLLQSQPEQFSKVLTKYKDSIDFNYLIQEIENPLLDLVDLENTQKRIVKSINDKELKNKLNKAFNKAIEKNK